jgi:two-component system response regulator FixJ
MRASLLSLLSVRSDLIIRGFRSGDDFLKQISRLDPGVLLIDQHMPGASGMEIVDSLKNSPVRFETIMLTGRGNVDLAVAAMKAGVYDFIEKPFDPSGLLSTIDAAFSNLEIATFATQRANAAESKISALSPREADVLKGLIKGRPNKIIAHELEISPRTVEIYRANMMEKLGVHSLAEALRIAFAAGLLPRD